MIKIESGDLPSGWAYSTIGEICLAPQYGWTTSGSNQGDIHLLRTTDITKGRIEWGSVPFCKDCPSEAEKYLLNDGDIVISRAGSVGYSYLVRKPQKSIFASYLIRFRPLINGKYLSLFLKSPSYWKAISEKSVGIALANVNASKLKQIVIPIAPLPEQARIADKVEELFSFLDAGVISLRAVQAKLKRYRKAVLKAAFEGKLTEQWRKTHQDQIEPAKKLLDRIKTERGIGQQAELEKSGVSNEGIPETWQLTALAIIADINPNLPKEGYPSDYEVSFLPMRAVEAKTGKFDGTIVKKYAEVKKGFTSFEDGDVIFAKITPCMENGKVAVVRGLKNGVGFGSTEFHVIRFFDNIIPELYYHYLQQDGFRKEAQMNMTGSAGQLRVPVRFLQNAIVPLPPIPEQGAIIEEIQRQFDLLYNVEILVTHGLAYSTNLRQSILKDAFLGKLVPQSPNDEPAERLLEHIKAERLTNKSKNNQVELLKYVK